MHVDMCFACITTVLTNHSGWNIVSYKHKRCCMLCMKFMQLIERCGYQDVAIHFRIYGLQALSTALYPFGPLPSISNLL